MANTDTSPLRQALTMLSGVAVISMIVASLSVMDGGTGRGMGWSLESCRSVELVDGQAKLQPSDVVALIECTAGRQCSTQAKPHVVVNRAPWFPL
ncbi:MAG: hypothetical protein ACI9SB_000710 [Candidatus Azotimanducaceae bacterium]|jgi:hypothetical protein